MAIYPSDREDLTSDEFLERYAKYDIDVRRKGLRIWFYSHLTQRPREGDSTSPMEAVQFVTKEYLYNGEPILHFVGSRTDPAVVAVAFTDAGRAWKNIREQWAARVNPRIPRRFRMLRGRRRKAK